MHYHCEVIIPPTDDVSGAVAAVMAQFDENGSGDDHCERTAFWDFWVIGGRWAGHKMLTGLDQDKLAAFRDWLTAEEVTVNGLQFGKQELNPPGQQHKVDKKWNEVFPREHFTPCPLFRHSNNQYGKDLGGALPGDVQRFVEVAPSMSCARVIFTGPSFSDGSLEAVFMLTDTAWNGCNHMPVKWDGTFGDALSQFRKWCDRASPEYVARVMPSDDWLAVTVDYHS